MRRRSFGQPFVLEQSGSPLWGKHQELLFNLRGLLQRAAALPVPSEEHLHTLRTTNPDKYTALVLSWAVELDRISATLQPVTDALKFYK